MSSRKSMVTSGNFVPVTSYKDVTESYKIRQVTEVTEVTGVEIG